ncbi:MAG: hypothetical protein PHP54_00295 [Clostridia bacterium]|nr:hypothetical protein [Clostridia bacterium]
MKKPNNPKLQNIVDKMPNNNKMAEDILIGLNNYTTKIKLDDDIKNSYYIYLNDTIYLANNADAQTNYSRLCLIAHESMHSIQSKKLQKLNFILSNIELVAFVVCVLLLIFKVSFLAIPIIYALNAVFSLAIRLVLEIDAVKNSVIISENYVRQLLGDEEAKIVEEEFAKETKKLLPIFLLALSWLKILKIIAIFLIYFFLK